MSKIKQLKIKQPDGSYGQNISLGADAKNIDLSSGEDLETGLNKKADKKHVHPIKTGNKPSKVTVAEANSLYVDVSKESGKDILYFTEDGSNWEILSGAGQLVEGRQFQINKASQTAKKGAEIFNNGQNKAIGQFSHAEGELTVALGEHSHAEGSYTTASGTNSHAEGLKTDAKGASSHSSGFGTVAQGDNSFVCGMWNSPNATDLFQVGNGKSESLKSNAFAIAEDGKGLFSGDIVLDAYTSKPISVKDILNKMHPVGSLYISSEPTSPAELFGGTWERINGRVLVGAGSPEPNTTNAFGALSGQSWRIAAKEKGGQDYNTLTVETIPPHSHPIQLSGEELLDKSVLNWTYGVNTRVYSGQDLVRPTGGGKPHNNMMPYYGCYMWVRLA